MAAVAESPVEVQLATVPAPTSVTVVDATAMLAVVVAGALAAPRASVTVSVTV